MNHYIQHFISTVAVACIIGQLYRQFGKIAADSGVVTETPDCSQMVFSIMRVEHKLLILLLQNIIIGFFRLQTRELTSHLHCLVFLLHLMLIGYEKKYSGTKKNHACCSKILLTVSCDSSVCTDDPEQDKTDCNSSRIKK